MKKLFMVTLIALLLILIGLAINQYDNRPRPKPGETLQQAVKAEADAKKTMQLHDAVNLVALQNANTQVSALTTQKVILCQQIKTAKLSQSLCN